MSSSSEPACCANDAPTLRWAANAFLKQTRKARHGDLFRVAAEASGFSMDAPLSEYVALVLRDPGAWAGRLPWTHPRARRSAVSALLAVLNLGDVSAALGAGVVADVTMRVERAWTVWKSSELPAPPTTPTTPTAENGDGEEGAASEEDYEIPPALPGRPGDGGNPRSRVDALEIQLKHANLTVEALECALREARDRACAADTRRRAALNIIDAARMLLETPE
jgi:hypothetical protein